MWRGAGLSDRFSSAASTVTEFSARTHLDQSAFAAEMIARRFRLAPATARANAEAFGFGGAE